MPFKKPDIVVPSLAERQEALFDRLELNSDKAQALVNQLESFLTEGLSKKSVEIGALETFVDALPSARLTGTVAVLTIQERAVIASRVDLAGGRALVGASAPVEYMNGEGVALSLVDEQATATALMNSCVKALQLLIHRNSNDAPEPTEVFICSSYPLQMGDKTSAVFLNFHELCPTLNEDPIEGTDLATLLNIGLERAGLNARVGGLLSTSVALLLAGEYERPSRTPRCLLSATVDQDVSFAFALADDFLRQLDIQSRILEVDVSGYRGIKMGNSDDNFITHQLLPRCNHDFEVDFTKCAGRSEFRRFERLVGGRYLGEMVRRLIVQALQHTCPEGVWTADSLPFDDVFALLDRSKVAAVCQRRWQWTPDADVVPVVGRCAQEILKRSAATLACMLAVLAKRTGRLQPALGGCSVALQGSLGACAAYQKFLREGLDTIFSKDTSSLIHFLTVDEAAVKGAAILGAMCI